MFSYYYFSIAILLHFTLIIVLSVSLPNPVDNKKEKKITGDSVNAIVINESEIEAELERIKSKKNQSRLAKEAEIRKLNSKIKSQEKTLRAIEFDKKKLEYIQQELLKKKEDTKKQLADFEEKKKKEKKALEVIEQKKVSTENRNKELEKETKKLQKGLAEQQLLKQLELEEETLKASNQNAEDAQIIDLYAKKIENKIKSYFKILPGQEGLSCKISINLVRDGSVIGVSILASSGIPSFDRAAENAVFSVAPFPVPESDRVFNKMKEITIVFTP